MNRHAGDCNLKACPGASRDKQREDYSSCKLRCPCAHEVHRLAKYTSRKDNYPPLSCPAVVPMLREGHRRGEAGSSGHPNEVTVHRETKTVTYMRVTGIKTQKYAPRVDVGAEAVTDVQRRANGTKLLSNLRASRLFEEHGARHTRLEFTSHCCSAALHAHV